MQHWLALWAFLAVSGPEKIHYPDKESSKKVVFQEELRFGGEDDETLWMDGTISCGIDVDAKGNIYVRDMGNTRVMAFDAEGKFLRQIGSEGQGPGEFQQIHFFQVQDDGSAVGYDFAGGGSSFVYYNPDMSFKTEKSVLNTGYFPRLLNISRNGSWVFARAFKGGGPNTQLCAVLFDRDLKPVDERWCHPVPIPDFNRVGELSMWKTFLPQRLKLLWEETIHFVAFGYDNSLYLVDGTQYRIERRDPQNQQTQLVLTRDMQPKKVDEAYKQSMVLFFEDTIYEQIPAIKDLVTAKVLAASIEDAGLPAYHHPVQGLIPIDDQGFVVMTEVDHGLGTFKGHLYDKDGTYLADFNYPGQGVYDIFGIRVIMRHGYMYGLEKNEDGDNQVVRYSYKVQ